jgi:hypothetical protein
MSRLTLLLPAFDRAFVADRSGRLARWFSRGDRHDTMAGRAAAVRECFEFIGTTIPVAALTRSLDAKDAAATLWLRADPSWVMADAVTVRMLACGNVDLSQTESDALAHALRPLFGDAGFLLEPATPSRWYLRCPAGAKLPTFDPPADVLGDDLARHLPAGDAGARWRHLLNETQMILHNHPLNIERARRGLTPVNSLWFWGAGVLPEWVRTTYTHVSSSDEVIVALARLARTALAPLHVGVLDSIAKVDSVLLDLAAAQYTELLDADWFAPIDALVKSRRLAELTLVFESGERVVFTRRHRWRFWRRSRVVGRA